MDREYSLEDALRESMQEVKEIQIGIREPKTLESMFTSRNKWVSEDASSSGKSI